MIIKITRSWDKWGNLEKPILEIKEEMSFSSRRTKNVLGKVSKEEEYFDVKSMKDLMEKVTHDFFKDCTNTRHG